MKPICVLALLAAVVAWLVLPLEHCRADGPPNEQVQSEQARKLEAEKELERQVLDALGVSDALRGDKPTRQDPLQQVSRHMKVVVNDLSNLSTGAPTQQKQQTIVSELDQLIAMLEKECEACRNGGRSGNNPRKPLNDSRIVKGPGGIGDLHAPRLDGKNWGDLPPRERARILQATDDGFPAHYQRILERYYRRVAEEQPAASPPNNETKP